MLSDIEKVGQQKPTRTSFLNLSGQVQDPRYKQPYIRFPLGAAASNTGMGQQASPTAPPASRVRWQQHWRHAWSACGTAIGGPIGGAIGGGLASCSAGSSHGGPVEAGPIRYLESWWA